MAVSTNRLSSHPSLYFAAAWTLCAFLISLDLVPRITQYKDTALWVYALIVGMNLVGLLAAWTIANEPLPPFVATDINYRFPYRSNLLLFWVIGTLTEVVVSGGVPLLWILTGSGRTYEDFGIPSIHGVMNAIYLFLTLSAFIGAMRERSKKSIIQFIIFLGWSVIVVSRALMAIVLLQAATFFLIDSRVSWQRKFGLIGIVSLAFFAVFGILGDARADQFSILESTGLGDIDPRLSGLVWVYTYLSSPIANLALNISVNSAQLKAVPTTFLLPLLPSAVQNWLGFETGFFGFSGYLAHDAFNVGTAFIQIFIDWGIGGVLVYDFILGLSGHLIWRSYCRKGRADILSLFIPCIVLTVFSNQFNQLPVILLFLLFGVLTKIEPSQSQKDITWV